MKSTYVLQKHCGEFKILYNFVHHKIFCYLCDLNNNIL